MDEPIRDLLGAVAEGKEGRRIPKKAQEVLRAIEDGERVAARGVSDAELVDVAVLLLGAIEASDRKQIEAVAVGVGAVPGVAGRLIEALGAMTLVFAAASGADWRDELQKQWARVVIEDAIG